MVKTVDRIVDPTNTEAVSRDLFAIKDFIYRIPASGHYLEFLQRGFKALKESDRYSIKGEGGSGKYPQGTQEHDIQQFLKGESDAIKAQKLGPAQGLLTDWLKITVNKDPNA